MSFYANVAAADVAVTTRYILVDKSSGDYPHVAAAAIFPKSLNVQLDKEGTGDWVLRIGVVEEVDATNGSVTFFYVRHLRGGFTILNEVIPLSLKKGIVLDQLSAISSEDVDGSTNWQNDANLANPTGSDTPPGAGDIVAEFEEVNGTATVSHSITVEYD